MEPHASHAEGTASAPPGARLVWAVALLGLWAWHGWMTLTLFGRQEPWQRLLDEQPIVSGRHPLHLYHGYLGAQALREYGSPSCYDPAFQAGYPKTPVFDSGSRPAELFLSLVGGAYHPAAYKVGLAACCLAVPFLLVSAAQGVGLSRLGSWLAAALGLLVWWATPCRRLLEAGELDLLLAALAAVSHVGLLVRFHQQTGVCCWVGLLMTACLGWFSQPLLFAALLPLSLVYYLSVGARHRWGWHLALLGVLVGGLAANAFWLTDWLTHWWIRSPLRPGTSLLAHRTLRTLWTASLWGDTADRALACVLFGAALLGIVLWNAGSQRVTARLLGLGTGGFLILALAGIAWEPLGRVGAEQLWVLSLWFATLPAVHAVLAVSHWVCRWTGSYGRGLALLGGCALLAGIGARSAVLNLALRCGSTYPLTFGLGPEQQELVDAIRTHTTPEARILWEENAGGRHASHWTALLPLLTQRAYLGGLDTEASIEHAYARFAEQFLLGRPIGSWTDTELEEFCQRYNIGWVVCCSPASVARFRVWTAAEAVTSVLSGGSSALFRIPPRPERPHSFVLKGRARLLQADWQRIALADVIPEDGKVVLSLHYQAGLRASPSRVQVEREPDPRDPIPFIRLCVPGPVTRLTLTWHDP